MIRRVTFDLTGLPPTPREVSNFLTDRSPQAYEKVIDRLLASPAYGERWARHWLDIVHYGDTHGYDKDKRRDHAWPYRDYVIQSLNADKPYDRFIREQIAGDLLCPDNPDALAATGFVAAGPWDFVGNVELVEGTVEKAKTRLLDRDDMVANTISTFCSVTIHCARCHDHKFDPIPQRDYYRLQAVFAGVDRGDRPWRDPSSAERAALHTRKAELTAEIAALRRHMESPDVPGVAKLDAEMAAVRERLMKLPRTTGGTASPSNGYHSEIASRPDVTKWVQVDLGRSVPIDLVRLIPARPTDFPDTPGFGFPLRFRVEVSDEPAFALPRVLLDATGADFANPGDDELVLQPTASARYIRVTATKLWQRPGGAADYLFALAELQVLSGGKDIQPGAAVAALDSIEAGRWGKTRLVDGFDSHGAIFATPERDATLLELQRLRAARAAEAARHVAPGDIAALEARVSELAVADRKLAMLPPPEMVYGLVTHAPRPIHVLARGEVEQPREEVQSGALSCVAGLDFAINHQPSTINEPRAALADWIASPKNPLTWRSIVNRVWQYHFGRGLVDTPNDFGRNGSRPSNPELLDWLAVELAARPSLKTLHRLIVLSAAYRRSSAGDATNERIDGDNRYLWRMERRRLDAEEVRDSVLAVAGTLDRTMGGPGFELFRFKDDHSPIYDHTAVEKINDPRGWRRAIYRFTVRSVPNPLMECLDCADPSINTPVRSSTITALQALALLNDPFLIDQAERFAACLQREAPGAPIDAAYLLCFGRSASGAERGALAAYARKHGLPAACRLLFNTNEFVFVD